jgi:hypothetical protein
MSGSPLNWIYLPYAISAAALTVLNVRDSLNIRERADAFFLLSRVGTLVLTVGTFFDNLRSWLDSFPQLLYPPNIYMASNNVTLVNAAWAEMDFRGAGFANSMFWFCDFNHIVLATVAVYTVTYLFVAFNYTPTMEAPLPPAQATRRTFQATTAVVVLLAVVQCVGFVHVVSGPHDGALKFDSVNETLPLHGIYRVTSVDKSSIMDGLLGVFVYSFGMIGFGLYQMVQLCRSRGCMGLTSTRFDMENSLSTWQGVLWFFVVFVSLPMNALSGGATGFRSVIGNLGEQMLFGAVLWLDFKLARRASAGEKGVYLEV